MESSLREKAILGGLWNTIERFGTAIFLFVTNLILARLLSPDDFGYIGMIFVFVALSNSIVEGGFTSALIQKRDADQTDFSTIFYWNIFLSVILYIILFLASPAIAYFYQMENLTIILRVQGIVLVFNALFLVHTSRLQKQLKFKTLAKGNLLAVTAGTVTAIFFALMGFGVWSLVVKYLLTSIVACCTFWIVSDWHPSLVFNFSSLRNLFKFGGFVFLSSLANSFYANFVSLILGKLFSPSTLGYFTQARKLEDVPRQILSSIINNVSFPLFSTLNDSTGKMQRAIDVSLNILCYICFPACTLMIVIAKPIVLLLFTDKWSASIPILQILCFYSMMASVVDFEQQILKSTGKSDLLFVTGIVRKGVGILFVVLGALGGLYGIVWAFVLSEYMGFIIISYPMKRLVQYGMTDQVRVMIPYFFVAALTGVLTHFISSLLFMSTNYIICVMADLVLFVLIYFVISGFLIRLDGYGMLKDIIISRWQKAFK